MLAGIKKYIFAACVTVIAITSVVVGYNHVTKASALESTNRNELYAPSEYNVAVNSKEGYTKIYENENFEYFYSSKKTILKIANKKSGFVWSTGADTNKKSDMDLKCKNVKQYSDEYYGCAIDTGPYDDGRDDQEYYGNINGLLSFTFYKDKTTSTITSLSESTSTSLFGHSTYANEWMFKMSYKNVLGTQVLFEFDFNLRITFTSDGFEVNMYEEDISGKSKDYLESVYILPNLGQSGGKMIQCSIKDPNEEGYGDCDFSDLSAVIDNPNTNLDGYIFVPDGSGALIRFDNVKYYSNGVDFYYDMYKDPYKSNYTDKEFQAGNEMYEPDYVSTKHISMPVWGVAYGDKQDAFVAYVTKGSEYFGLVYRGRNEDNEYASIRPRFERNRTYVYTFGEGMGTEQQLTGDELFKYDIGVSYNFLQGDGSDGTLPADYVGMALKYRSYLQNNNLVKADVETKVGPKVDFLIADVKEGIFGYSDVNVTNTSQIENMLSDLHNEGIENVTSTLYGWQNGGISKAKPWTIDFNDVAGGKKGFKNVVSTAKEYGYDINFYQQYAMINEAQVSSFAAYCVKALSRDYGIYILSDLNKPITWWEFTNADVAGEWLNKQAKELAKLGDNVGITTGGITTLLVPDYGKKLSYSGAKNSLYHSTKDASGFLPLAGDTPNSFLWKNYNEFYNLSVYNSQYQCETDSVPFMEIVFSGIINMYAEYSNFSFYDTLSQLKMIDYNLNPSFIISASENTDIMYTNARDWFTTSYDSYHPIINEICAKVLPALKLIEGKTIINREVIELPNNELGVYVNTYATHENGVIGNDKEVLAINYLNHAQEIEYNGQMVNIPAESVFDLVRGCVVC